MRSESQKYDQFHLQRLITSAVSVLSLAFWLPFASSAVVQAQGQSSSYVSSVWVSDNGDGTFTNPILHADYSDPDVIRVGDDFYMTASSFNVAPGLPVLHSKDLVNWTLINHALPRLMPDQHFQQPRHGQGVWAPSLRHHNGEFYIFWGDPDFGIYMVKTDDPAGSWSQPHLVKAGKGLIDPSPLWDDDGNAYLVHAYARSRSGINTVLVVQKMSTDGASVLEKPVLVFDGHENGQRVVEGPKFLKKDDFYYILAPAGGVTEGWQLALRSKNPFGPYKHKIVLHQGNTEINGPHQGGLVDLESGESWFVHFQDKGVYGRIVHLNPVEWKNGWPKMGIDQNNDGVGEPVLTHKKPDVGETASKIRTPKESDEFNSPELGLQWQWHANPLENYGMASNLVFYRLYGVPMNESAKNLWDVPNLLLQKFPAPKFQATTKLTFRPHMIGEKAGLIIMGEDYGYIAVERTPESYKIKQIINEGADSGKGEKIIAEHKIKSADEQITLWFRTVIQNKGESTFYFSSNGKEFQKLGESFQAKEGRWIGAKVGLFCVQPSEESASKEDYLEYSGQHSGFADLDWFRIEPVEKL